MTRQLTLTKHFSMTKVSMKAVIWTVGRGFIRSILRCVCENPIAWQTGHNFAWGSIMIPLARFSNICFACIIKTYLTPTRVVCCRNWIVNYVIFCVIRMWSYAYIYASKHISLRMIKKWWICGPKVFVLEYNTTNIRTKVMRLVVEKNLWTQVICMQDWFICHWRQKTRRQLWRRTLCCKKRLSSLRSRRIYKGCLTNKYSVNYFADFSEGEW